MSTDNLITDNERWLISFYRTSEINGALFFGELADRLRPGPYTPQITAQFADEANHARYWTDCLNELGMQPIRLDRSYQDGFLTEAGIPVNMMEVLAVTQVFEQRVMKQYASHVHRPGIHPVVAATINRIIDDERRHIRWVRRALQKMRVSMGDVPVAEALDHFRQADTRILANLNSEFEQRLDFAS